MSFKQCVFMHVNYVNYRWMESLSNVYTPVGFSIHVNGSTCNDVPGYNATFQPHQFSCDFNINEWFPRSSIVVYSCENNKLVNGYWVWSKWMRWKPGLRFAWNPCETWVPCTPRFYASVNTSSYSSLRIYLIAISLCRRNIWSLYFEYLVLVV